MMGDNPGNQGRHGLASVIGVLGGLLFSVILITMVSGCAVFFGHRQDERGVRLERYHDDHYYERHRDQYGGRHRDRYDQQHRGGYVEDHRDGGALGILIFFLWA